MTDLESTKKSPTLPSEQRKLNFYEILDVPVDATRLQIREAYIRLKSAFSSSGHVLYSLVTEEDARHSIEMLDEAYHVLDDEVLRRDYDAKVMGKTASTIKKAENFDHNHGIFQGNSQQLEHRFGGTYGHPQRLGKETAPIDFWQGDQSEISRRESDPVNLRVREHSAKKKRFSTMAFDDMTKSQVQSYIEKASQIDGPFFRGLRELLSVTQEEIQDKTKISLQYIKALENDDFKILPSLVYVKGFLKCYLEYLGLDREAPILIKSYTETYQSWRAKKGM